MSNYFNSPKKRQDGVNRRRDCSKALYYYGEKNENQSTASFSLVSIIFFYWWLVCEVSDELLQGGGKSEEWESIIVIFGDQTYQTGTKNEEAKTTDIL